MPLAIKAAGGGGSNGRRKATPSIERVEVTSLFQNCEATTAFAGTMAHFANLTTIDSNSCLDLHLVDEEWVDGMGWKGHGNRNRAT